MGGARLYFLEPRRLAIADEQNRLICNIRGYSLAILDESRKKTIERTPYNPGTRVCPEADIPKEEEVPELIGMGEWNGIVQEVRLLSEKDYENARNRFNELTGELGQSNATLETYFLRRFFPHKETLGQLGGRSING